MQNSLTLTINHKSVFIMFNIAIYCKRFLWLAFLLPLSHWCSTAIRIIIKRKNAFEFDFLYFSLPSYVECSSNNKGELFALKSVRKKYDKISQNDTYRYERTRASEWKKLNLHWSSWYKVNLNIYHCSTGISRFIFRNQGNIPCGSFVIYYSYDVDLS
jgi:hypothetical protein